MQSRAPNDNPKMNVWAVICSVVVAIAIFLVGLPAIILFGPDWLNNAVAWGIALLGALGAIVAFFGACRSIRAYRMGQAGEDEAALRNLLVGFFMLVVACGILDQCPYYQSEGNPPWLTILTIATFIGLGVSGGLLLLRKWIRRVARQATQEKDEAK